jgi:hypothetical protein
MHRRVIRRTREDVRIALLRHPLLPLFIDPGWYLGRYRDVFKAGADPQEHFLGPGLQEGRDPGPFADLSYLHTQRAGLPVDNAAILLEFLETGLTRGQSPSPYVNLRWYASAFEDVPTSPVGALRHLIEEGVPSGRDPGPFLDLSDYGTRLPDIRHSRIDPFHYFTAIGQHLERFPHPVWDERRYVDANEFVRFALGVGKYLHGFEHFCAIGHLEVVRGEVLLPLLVDGHPLEFSEARYLDANPDVALLVAEGRVPNGVSHFFAQGHREVSAGDRPLAPASTVAHLLSPSMRGVPSSPRRFLMALIHHDRDRVVDEHVRSAINAYQSADIDVHVVSSGADEESQTFLSELGVPIHLRSRNDDLRDFGGWNLLLEQLGEKQLRGYERVILANDSSYFPARDPEPFFTALEASASDIWAATDSFSGGRYHLQSYFLALRPRAVEIIAPELARRAERHPNPTKLGLIQWFEIGLSQYAASQGLSLEAFFSVADLVNPATALSPPDPRPLSHLAVTVTNLMHHYWRTSLAAGLPFLKVELLRDNPLGVDIAGWESAIDGPCTAERITDHLARMRR